MATLSSTGRFAAGEACADNDILYGPYATIAAAHAALLNAEQNVVGRTVGIQTGNTIEEYWYQGGTDQVNLVKKQEASIEVDSELSATSENPVQNKVVKSALDSKAPSTNIQKSALASDVRTSLGLADSALQSETDPTVPSWAKAETKPSYTASEVGAIPDGDKGVANGVATLGSDGKVPQSQLPSYVDDVLEYSNQSSFPATGESGKIYVALDTNKTYRWSGSEYVEISQSLALGETSSTAFAGNRGKAIEDKIPSGASSSNKLVTASDLSGKVDKVSGATENNFASFDSNGGIKDSLKKESDFATSEQGTKADNAIPMPQGGSTGQVLKKTQGGVGWDNETTELPSTTGNTGKVLKVNSSGTGVEWANESGGGGTSDYSNLSNKPSINSVPLSGDKTSGELGLQEALASGTNIKTINGSSILGSGNLLTGQKYINADTFGDLPEAAEAYQNAIGLVPSTTTSGSIDYYTCIYGEYEYNSSTFTGWHWALAGTSSPIVSVQRVDVAQSKQPFEIKDLYLINASGLVISNSVGALFKYDVEGVDKVFVTGKSWTTTDPESFRDFLCWYDINGNYLNGSLSSEYRCLFNTTRADLTNAEYPVPQGAKTLILNVAHAYIDNPTPAVLIQTPVPQSLVKEQVTPNTIIYGTVSIDVNMPLDATSNSEITRTTRNSGFGIIFPQSYSNVGTPTQVIAMLHGSTGYVSPAVLGYPEDSAHTGWTNWKQQYLDAGFAVMDINGYGVSSSNDQYSKPFGNPMCVETLFKAFNLIRDLYNVKDKLLLHGTSMGGTNAMSYLLNHPETVSGVALFAPALAPYYVHIIVPDKGYSGADVAAAWGYADWSEMDSDGCSKMIGYSPMMEDDFYWVGNTINRQSYQLLSAKTRLANIPIRIWHGDNDQNVFYEQSVKFVDLLKRSNTPVSLRTCVNGEHNISGGAVAYVRNEAVSWFKRFVNV